MFLRIRYLFYSLVAISAVAFAVRQWRISSEHELLEIYRDMGPVELLQILLVAATGLGFCLLDRYKTFQGDARLLDRAFTQFSGACSLLLVARELDYEFMGYMDEPRYLTILGLMVLAVCFYGARNWKNVWAGAKALARFESAALFGAGGIFYLFIAQVLGHKQTRFLFYPDLANISRRILEESFELAGIFLIFAGIVELHLFVASRCKPEIPGRDFSFDSELEKMLEYASPMPEKSAEPSFVSTEERARTQALSRTEQTLLLAADRLAHRVKELDRALIESKRSSASMSASVLVIGFTLVIALIWFAYIQREHAIEESTNRQMSLLAEQYNAEPERWKKKNPFRFESLRAAIREDVASEFKFEKFFQRNHHRG